MSADRTIDPELPWGCWLRIQPRDYFKAVFIDDLTGEEWPTIREAFWRGRLRMPLRNDKVPEDQMEFLHGVLSQIARRYASSGERSADTFHGSGQFCDWYFAWLHNQGLIDEFKGHLTAEGWAVLHMLMATRPQPVRQDRPGRATVRQLTEVGLGPEEREARLGRVEQMASDWGRRLSAEADRRVAARHPGRARRRSGSRAADHLVAVLRHRRAARRLLRMALRTTRPLVCLGRDGQWASASRTDAASADGDDRRA
jgi:hypothetical protein